MVLVSRAGHGPCFRGLTPTSCLTLFLPSWRGRVRASGEAVFSPCWPDEAESGPWGSDDPRGPGEAESGPQGLDEAESLRSCSIGNVVGAYQLYLIGYPSIRSPTVAPEPLGDSGRIARGLSRLARACSGLPEGVAPEPPGDSGGIARGVSRLSRGCSGLPEGARERTRWG